MKIPLTALLSVTEELVRQAKNQMPTLRQGEVVKHEWLKNGVYYRKTVLENLIYKPNMISKLKKLVNSKF